MKHFTYILRTVLFLLLLSLYSITHAQPLTDNGSLQELDSAQISLLTCGPGSEIYSLYGHSAIRVHDLKTQTDIVINYGMFSFRQKNFFLRFVFGRTDYQMGIVPFAEFMAEYQTERRWVIEQVLNLTPNEKERIVSAIAVNYRPENRSYRYNYFYDNCTTRARDMILSGIEERVIFPTTNNAHATYRSMVHEWTANAPWARFGNDLLLGIEADKATTLNEQQFLPDTLRKDFAKAYIKSGSRPLVAATNWLITPANVQQPSIKASFSPTVLMPGILGLAILVTLWGIRTAFGRKIATAFDCLMVLSTWLAGLILLAMVFSQHPTVNINLQILLLNPLAILLLFPRIRRKKFTLPFFMGCIGVFLTGAFFQQYAEGMLFLALSLLLRLTAQSTRIPALHPRN